MKKLKQKVRCFTTGMKGWIARARSDIETAPFIGKLVRKSKKLVLPGFQKIPLYDVMVFFVQSLGKGVVFQRAAAMTYRIFVALVPMIIALFSVISFLGPNVQQSLLDMLESVVPAYVWPAISSIISDVVMRRHGTLSSFMFLLGLYFTVICINGMLAAMDTSYFNDRKRNIFKQLILSVGIMMMMFALTIVVVGLFIGASMLMRYIHHSISISGKGYAITVHGIKWILTYAAIYFFVSFLYYIAPSKRTHYRFFSAASSTCTIMLLILLIILNFYFSNFSNYNLIYGSLGAIFAILLSINWSSIIMLICYDLNVSIAKAKESKQSLFDAGTSCLNDKVDITVDDDQYEKTENYNMRK